MQYTILIDINKCVGCGSCIVACKQEHGLKLGEYWTHIQEIGPFGKYPDLNSLYWVPIACQQCYDPSCVKVCPTGASYKRDDGIVLINPDKCIGCQYCTMNCPYDVRVYNKEKGIVEKCTLCVHRISAGLEPACVTACVSKARIFGDLDDPNSDASKALKEAGDRGFQLQPSAGTNPSTHYLLKNWEWKGR